PALPVAQRAENASLLATLLLLQAEAYDLVGQTDKARAVRLDSLGWARYGFGSDWSVKAKMREIAALNP
ncbi:MAG: ATP-dependent transcriptional regulator, partial [Rhodobacteraceae bacterium]|nr:ATP-dependent transcriptional regulator [Paracoccaceae bacterium]